MTEDTHSLGALDRALGLELALRAERAAVNRVRGALGSRHLHPEMLLNLCAAATTLRRDLLAVQLCRSRVWMSSAEATIAVVRDGDPRPTAAGWMRARDDCFA